MKRLLIGIVTVALMFTFIFNASASTSSEPEANKEVVSRLKSDYLSSSKLSERGVRLVDTSLGINIPNIDKGYVDRLSLDFNLSNIDDSYFNNDENLLEYAVKQSNSIKKKKLTRFLIQN